MGALAQGAAAALGRHPKGTVPERKKRWLLRFRLVAYRHAARGVDCYTVVCLWDRFGRGRLPGAIRGINRTRLWKSWKAIRKELKKSSVRDVIDFLDYDVNPDVWISRLLAHIASGDYEPETPRRFTLGKASGFSRAMTLPAIPDLVLYRTILDYVYERTKWRTQRNVYFLRDEISKAQVFRFSLKWTTGVLR